MSTKREAGVVTRAEQYRPGINMPEGPDSDLNKWSRKITQPKSQGASQAMLYATGLTEADMNKPQVGISLGLVAREPVQQTLAFVRERGEERRRSGFDGRVSVQHDWCVRRD